MTQRLFAESNQVQNSMAEVPGIVCRFLYADRILEKVWVATSPPADCWNLMRYFFFVDFSGCGGQPVTLEDGECWGIRDDVTSVVAGVLRTLPCSVCKEVTSLRTSPYRKEAVWSNTPPTHIHTTQAAFLLVVSTPSPPTPPLLSVGQAATWKAVMACTQAWSPDAKQGLFEMLIAGRGGQERKRRGRGASGGAPQLLRVFTSRFCLSP